MGGMSAGAAQIEGVCWGVGVDWSMKCPDVFDGVARFVVIDVCWGVC